MPIPDSPHLADLRTAVQSGRLVSVIGIGVSRQVAKPCFVNGFDVVTWPGLVRHGIQHCLDLGLIDSKEAGHLNEMVDWEKIQHRVHVGEESTRLLHECSPGTYQKWLDDTIGRVEVGDPRLIEALVRLSAFITSLNYDTLPEQVTQRASVTWKRPDRVSLVVEGKRVHDAGLNREAILHPHGCWTEAESVVLGTQSYREVTTHPHALAIQRLFALSHTMMFVGCGATFDDPNFSQFLPAATAILKDTTKSHFVLCRNSEVEQWKGKAPWLHPVPYGDEYTDLLPFLQDLAKYRGEPPPEPPPSGPAPTPPPGPVFAAEWARTTQKIDPELAAELVTLKREPATEKLQALATGAIGELGIQTRVPREVTTFVAGYLAKQRILETEEGGRWVLVRDRNSWETAAATSGVRLILVAHPDLDFETDHDYFTQTAQAGGHAVLYSTLLGRTDDENIIRLGQPSKHDLTESLKKHRVPAARAEKLVNQANGNVSLLLRYLTGTPVRPAWAKPEVVAKFARLALLGGWRSDRLSDRQAVGDIVHADYFTWVDQLAPLIAGEEPPFVHSQSAFRPVSRYENWQLLGPLLTDADLDRFQQIAITTLRQVDPKFTRADGESIVSEFKKEDPIYSEALRQGLAETAALLGAKPEALTECSPNKARQVASIVVHSVLHQADWKRWASLGSLLTLLAEADPATYLALVRDDLNRREASAIRTLFDKRDDGIFGEFHHAGILWSLEVLAWKPELLNRVALILAELDQAPLPENMGNSPLATLRTVFLPWLPQTLATVSQRKTAVETIIRDFPATGWKLLLELLPEGHSSSGYTQRPVWRDWIPSERNDGATNRERWEQERNYAELALKMALADPGRLEKLFDHLLYLPHPAFDAIVTTIKSTPISGLPEQKRLPLWERIVQEVRRHRKYSTADWAAPKEVIDRLDELAATIAPTSPAVRHQFLFNFESHDFWDDNDDYEKSEQKIRRLRSEAVTELLADSAIPGVLEFARKVRLPFYVGVALGDLAPADADVVLLPNYLTTGGANTDVARGYTAARFEKSGLGWVQALPLKQWSPERIGLFFNWLPFRQAVWLVADEILGDRANEYWQHVNVRPYGEPPELLAAAEKLLQYGRGPSALRAVHGLIYGHHTVPDDLALRAAKAFLQTYSEAFRHDLHDLREVIKFLQDSPDADQAELARIEWLLLPMFDRIEGERPKVLERNLANDPAFFVSVIKGCYRGKGEPKPPEGDVDEKKREDATNGYRLLRNWQLVPGTSADQELNSEELQSWITEVRNRTEPSGHWEVAQTHIGHVLVYASVDPDGLFLHRGAAAILDLPAHDDMRRGYGMELFNRRGAYFVGRGQPDREQEAKYRKLADEINAAGFTNIATTLYALAESYARTAEREEKRADLTE